MDKRDNLEERGGNNISDIGDAPLPPSATEGNSVEQKYENCEAISTGLKCDNPNCDWKDPTISFDGMEEYINKPCPKCGENLLTEADYKNAMTVKLTADFINSLSPEELVEISKSIDPNALINDPMFLGAEGLENIMNENATSLIINTHRELKVTHVKLNSVPNDERFVTQQAMPQGEKAGIKNSPSWKEIVEKEAEKAFGLLEINDFEVEAFSVGMNRAKDYYEKEVVEPLKEESEKRMRALESLTPSGSEYVDDIDACVKCVREQRDSTYRFIGKQNKELDTLREENERLKKALEKIAKWELPETGKYFDNDKTRPISYEANYGSQGAKIFIQSIATEALKLK